MRSQLEWDLHFLRRAKLASDMSKDPSTQTGAVIVRPNRTAVSDGYNGFAGPMPDLPELYANREEKYERIVHCEMNAVLTAAQSVRGCTLYTWPFASCNRCAVHMIQAGITTFVFPKLPADKAERWASSLAKTLQYFKECGLQWREIECDTLV